MAMTRPSSTSHGGPRRSGVWWSRLHFLFRLLGLAGALAICAALVLIAPRAVRDLTTAVQDTRDPLRCIGGWLAVGGGAALAVWLFVELATLLFQVAGRRSAFGFHAVCQMILAAVLLGVVNYLSFRHYLRIDWTRGGYFTLPAEERQQLARLDRRAETTVIVYQRHKTFGALTDKPDRYDYAAERKVVEKVKDLVDLLRAVGPQLRVEVLDVEEEGFDRKLERLTTRYPRLARAIDQAAENSIFIASGDHLQQMSFNEFYQLDKVRSRQDNKGRGNLVLLGQGAGGRGIEPFVHRILNLEQRRPRVGVLVIHEVLTTEGVEPPLTLSGMKKALEANGFDVTDVVLKKGWERGGPAGPEPAADSIDESRLERLESDLEDLEAEIQDLKRVEKVWATRVDDLTPKPGEDEAKRLDELSKKYREELDGERLTAEGRRRSLEVLSARLRSVRDDLASLEKDRASRRQERDRLDLDRIAEARRLTDVKSKLAYALANCDLIVVPRMTRMTTNQLIPPRLYRLDRQQVEALRDYLAAGKPLLACFGPINERPDMRMAPGTPPSGPDGLEDLLTELGFRLGKETVLYSADRKAMTERRDSFLRSGGEDAPPLDFESSLTSVKDAWPTRAASLAPSRLREGLRVVAHSVGKGFDIRLRFPRPIYYEPPAGTRLEEEPTFLLSPSGWSEPQPYRDSDRRGRFESTPPGKEETRRRGQFPLGAAVQVSLPTSWGKEARGKHVRIAAIGQGEAFVGTDLSPPRERLLLQTVNWLLGRDDYLPRDSQPWSYPRLALLPDQPDHDRWLWGTRLGLPALFAFLGIGMLLFRRLR